MRRFRPGVLPPRRVALRASIRIARLGLTLAPRVLPPAAVAQPAPLATAVDSVQFRAFRWRSIGPNRGGRSTAVAGSARRSREYYVGTSRRPA